MSRVRALRENYLQRALCHLSLLSNVGRGMIYLDYTGQRIRLDWLLEVYRNKLTIQQVVKRFGEKSKSQMMDYYASLIFNYGDFIVKQNEVEIDEFIKWNIENSDRIYREYLGLLDSEPK